MNSVQSAVLSAYAAACLVVSASAVTDLADGTFSGALDWTDKTYRGGEYTASASVTFTSISEGYSEGEWNTMPRSVFDLRAYPDSVITLTGDYLFLGHAQTNVYRGGTWNVRALKLSGGSSLWFYGDNRATLTDGTKWQVASFIVAENSTRATDGGSYHPNVLTLSGGAELSDGDVPEKGPFAVGGKYYRGGKNRLEVTDGAKVSLTGTYANFSTTDTSFWRDPDHMPAPVTSNAVAVTGVGSSFVSQYLTMQGHGDSFVVSDGAEASFTVAARLGYYGSTYSLAELEGFVGNRLVATGAGSKISLANAYVGGAFSTDGDGNGLEVLDGASLKATGDIYLGYRGSPFNHLIVSNATANVNYLQLAASGACSNWVWVTGESAALTSSYDWVLFDSGAYNDVRVDDGATFALAGVSNMGPGHDNRILVDGGVFAAKKSFGFGTGSGHVIDIRNGGSFALSQDFGFKSSQDCVLRLSGSETKGRVGYWMDLGDGCGSTIEVLDGAWLEIPRLRIGGSEDRVTNTLPRHVFVIGTGATVRQPANSEEDHVMVCSSGNRLVLSNGTLSVARDMYFPLAVDGIANADNVLTFAGMSPKLTSHGGTRKLDVGTGSTLRFEVPASGYEADCLPLMDNLILEMTEGATLAASVAAFREASPKRGNFQLTKISVDTVVSIPDSVLEAANATLPHGCRFYVKDGALFLSVGTNRGMSVIIR